MSGSVVEGKNRNVHLSAVLPFRVSEAAGKPLRISGVAMVAGMSRNFNVYTPDELQAFAEKLANAPVYIEHVSASRAIGKVTETAFNKEGRAITYVAEIYDEAVADKIRNGLIQHVSVGADYQVMDLVNAKVPQGLYNAELSLVAVPGMPETTIHVLEHLAAASKNSSKIKLQTKELLQDLQCVFCGKPGEYLVSVCTSCGDNAQSLVLQALEHLPVRELRLAASVHEAEGDEPTLFSAFKVRFVCHGDNPCDRCKALDGKEFIYGSEPEVPLHPNCKCGYELVERLAVQVYSHGVENLEEKDASKIAEMVAAKVSEKISQENASLKQKLAEAEQTSAEKDAQVARSQKYGIGVKDGSHVTKPSEYADLEDDQFADPVNYRYPIDAEHVQASLTDFNAPENRAGYTAEEQAKILAKIVVTAFAAGVEVTYQPEDAAYQALPEELKAKLQGYTKEQPVEERLRVAEVKIGQQNTLLEKYRQIAPGVELLAEAPVLMPVAEAVSDIKAVLPASMVQRSWSLGPQRMCQELHRVINKLEKRAGGR